MLFLALSKHLLRFPHDRGGKVLHISPEKFLTDLLYQQSQAQIIAMDIDPLGMIHAREPGFASDLMAIGVKDNCFDVVICIHVLEHVLDDAKALAEIYRILKPGGIAVIMVPFAPISQTCEWGEPNILVFYHVRDYSMCDFTERLHLFDVTEIKPEEVLNATELQRYSIPLNQIVYVCKKK